MPKNAPDLSIEAMQFYEDHPVEFCQDLITGVDFDDWQIEAFDNLIEHHFIAISAGSGVGKTVWLALLLCWFLGTKPFSKVPCTAPSQHQLNDLLWGEAHKWISRSPFLGGMFDWTQTKIAVKKYEPQWFAVARTARVSPNGAVAEGLQGFHAEENLLYIIDEASGVPDEIFPAVEGALTGKNAYAVLCANPTRLSGYFWSIFHDPAMSGLYKLMHVSCLDSKFVEQRYIQMMEARYGRDHPIWQIKVEGNFPTADVNLLFPPADIELFKHHSPIDLRGLRLEIEFGLDIGRSHNKSILCIRKGNVILAYEEKALLGGISDTVDVFDWACDFIRLYEPSAVKVDCVGIGAGAYDLLLREFPQIIKPVIGQAKAEETKVQRYANLRAQGYWELRDILPTIYCKKVPDQLIVELSRIEYKIQNGKILLTAKKDMRESPDYADATMYAFLDSNICVDKHVPVASVNFGTANDSLGKTSNWDRIGNKSPASLSNKWDVLHA